MEGYIDDSKIDSIFKLNLKMSLEYNKNNYTMMYKGKLRDGSYLMFVDIDLNEVKALTECKIEIKGTIDIEYLKYEGTAIVTHAIDGANCFKLSEIKLKRVDQRAYKRVPYRRSINITSPVETTAVLMNISGSGALIYSSKELNAERISFNFVLLKKELKLSAKVIEEKWDKHNQVYSIRCQFIDIDEKDRETILKAVKAITLNAIQRIKTIK